MMKTFTTRQTSKTRHILIFDFAKGEFYDALHKEKLKNRSRGEDERSVPKLLSSEILLVQNVAGSVFCQRPLKCPQNEVISFVL